MFFPEMLLRTFLFGTLLFLAGNYDTPVTCDGVENLSGSTKSQLSPLNNHSQTPSGTSTQDFLRMVTTPVAILYNITGDPKLSKQCLPDEVLKNGKPNGNLKNIFVMKQNHFGKIFIQSSR